MDPKLTWKRNHAVTSIKYNEAGLESAPRSESQATHIRANVAAARHDIRTAERLRRTRASLPADRRLRVLSGGGGGGELEKRWSKQNCISKGSPNLQVSKCAHVILSGNLQECTLLLSNLNLPTVL